METFSKIKKQINEAGYLGNAASDIFRVKHNVGTGGGPKKRMNPNRLIFRSPTKEEYKAAGLNPGDWQMGQVRTLSRILYDFDILKTYFRTKKVPYDPNDRVGKRYQANARGVNASRKLLQVVTNAFSPDDPITYLQYTLRTLKQFREEDFLPSDLERILDATQDWESFTELQKFITAIYVDINGIKSYKEASPLDSSAIRSLAHKLEFCLSQLLNDANKTKTQIKYLFNKACALLQRIKDTPNITDETLLGQHQNITVKALYEMVDAEFKQAEVVPEKIHANTLLHQRAVRGFNALGILMRRDGFAGGLTTKNVFEYLHSNRPDVIKNISYIYGLPPEEWNGDRFPTWESLAQFFYSPEMLAKIENNIVQVEDRVGKKGAWITVEYATLEKRQKKLTEMLKNYQETQEKKYDPSSLDAVKDRYEEQLQKVEDLRTSRQEVSDQLRALKKQLNPFSKAERIAYTNLTDEEIDKIKKQIGDLEVELASIKSTTHSETKKLANMHYAVVHFGERQRTPQSVETKLGNLSKDLTVVLELMQKYIPAETFDEFMFNKKDNITTIRGSAPVVQNAESLDYYTFSFVVSANPKMKNFDKIIKFMEDELHLFAIEFNSQQKFDTMEAAKDAGIVDVVNPWVEPFEDEYQGDAGYKETLLGTKIGVDYPKCYLYKVLKAQPKFGNKIAQALVNSVNNRFGTQIEVYDEPEYQEVNVSLGS